MHQNYQPLTPLFSLVSHKPKSTLLCANFTPCGNYVFCGGTDRQIRLYNPMKSNAIASARPNALPPPANLIRTYTPSTSHSISSISSNKSNTLFCCSPGDSTALVWDITRCGAPPPAPGTSASHTETGPGPTAKLVGHGPGPVNHVMMAGGSLFDGGHLVVTSAYDRTVKVWDLRAGDSLSVRCIATLPAAADSVTSSYLPDRDSTG
jgi:mitogen-activated protein kinase organizer 1